MHSVVDLLLHAFSLLPLIKTRSTAALVALLVDLLIALEDTPRETVDLATALLIARVHILIKQNAGALAPLHTLARLIAVYPQCLWASELLFACSYCLATEWKSPLEQQVLLTVIHSALAYGSIQNDEKRDVYVECLVLPLVSLLKDHQELVSPMLSLVAKIQTTQQYQPRLSKQTMICDQIVPGWDVFVHAQASMQLAQQESAGNKWLDSLFTDSQSTQVSEKAHDKQSWLVLLLGSLLIDQRSSLRNNALRVFARQHAIDSAFWSSSNARLLVSGLVYLLSQQQSSHALWDRYSHWMTECFYIVASLAVSSTETMAIVLRVIKRMTAVESMQPLAIRLLLRIWEQDARVYPRLEPLLHQEVSADENLDLHVVTMATIESICVKDPECGLEYLSRIQQFLEDPLVSVASMAVNAIRALCAADCLDFYAAFKIVSLKLRKGKITCGDDALFQERLCAFYAIGGQQDEESTAGNEKHTAKLLAQLWQYAEDDEVPSLVRRQALIAVNSFSISALGLGLPDAHAQLDDSESEEDDEDTDKVQWIVTRLQDEADEDVRLELERLAVRVLDYECGQLNPSSVSSASQTHVISQSATRDLEKHLPDRRDAMALCTTNANADDSTGLLFAYEHSEDTAMSGTMRKDKRIKLATQRVETMAQTLTQIVGDHKTPWGNTQEPTESSFLRMLGLLEGWQSFMRKYVQAIDTLATLKAPSRDDGSAPIVEESVIELVRNQMELLDVQSNTDTATLTAAGAFVYQIQTAELLGTSSELHAICNSAIEQWIARLAHAIEELKVFPGKEAHLPIVSLIGALHEAVGPLCGDAAVSEDTQQTRLYRIVSLLTPLTQTHHAPLLQAAALLCLGRIGGLYGQIGQGVQTSQAYVKTISDTLTNVLFRVTATSSDVSGDKMFALTSTKLVKIDWRFPKNVPWADDSIVVVWASLMALARLSQAFVRVRHSVWLLQVQDLLQHMWSQVEFDYNWSIVGVALAPILVECVAFNLSSLSTVDEFVSKSLQYVDEITATRKSSRNSAFLLVASSYLHCQVRDKQDYTSVFLQCMRNTLALASAQSCSPARMLVLASIANLFHHSFGVAALSRTHRQAAQTVAFTYDLESVDAFMAIVRAELDVAPNAFSLTIWGAIADQRELFYVAVKKKTFDVEVSSLPVTSLLQKTFVLLLQQQADLVAAQSLLQCLAQVKKPLPQLDYASLLLRLLRQFVGNDNLMVACIRFAGTQPACHDMIINNLLTANQYWVFAPTIQQALVQILNQVSTCLSSDALKHTIKITFDWLLDAWQTSPGPSTGLLFSTWMDAVLGLLGSDTKRSLDGEALIALKSVLVTYTLPRLPFHPDNALSSSLLQQFADILVSVGRPDAASVYLPESAFLTGTADSSCWCSGVLLVQVLRSRAVFPIEQHGAIVCKWLLQQQFEKWEALSSQVRDSLLWNLASVIESVATPSENISWLLEVLDVFDRSRTNTEAIPGASTKCQILFWFVVSALASGQHLLSQEQYLLVSDGDPHILIQQLVPMGLTLELGSGRKVQTIVERLWSILLQLESRSFQQDDAYLRCLRIVARMMQVVDIPVLSRIQPDTTKYWCESRLSS